MSFKVRKSLVIGLGGTGRDAVLHAKRHCEEVYGEVPPTTRFLVLDTTSADDLQLEDRDIALASHEFNSLTVHNPETLVRYNDDIRAWFPSDVSPRAVTSGAGQIRALGRLALHANTGVRDSLNRLVNEINTWETSRQGKFELFDEGKTLYVSLVGSLAGGTGSGIFLDIAFLLRACDNLKTSDKLTAYLLLPGAFMGKPATRNVEPNTYAALRELDYYMGMKGTPDPATFGFGGRPIEIAPQPFDFIYLINNVTTAGTVYSKVRHLTEFLGRGIFMSLGASGKTAGDIWDNLAHQLQDQQKVRGKAAHYSSFGLSELVYDPDRFVRRCSLEMAKELVRTLFLGEQVDAGEAVAEFARQYKLREEGAEHNEVIDGLVPHAQPRKFQVPEKHNKQSVTEMLSRAPSYVKREQTRAEEESARNLITMTDETSDAVHDLVQERLDGANGLAWCTGFLRTLRGRMDGLRDEMTIEEQDMRDKLRKEEALLAELGKEREDLRDGIFNRRRWSDLAERAERTVRRCARWRIERVRRSQAARFFGALIEEIDKELRHVEALKELADNLIEKLERDLEDLRLDVRQAQPFAKVFEPRGTVPKAGAAEFVKWLSAKHRTIAGLSELSARKVERILLEFAGSQPELEAARADTIEGVLERVPEEERLAAIRDLATMAEPLWSYDQGHVTGSKKPTELFLVGTASDTDSILQDPNILREVAPERTTNPSLVGTGDTKRITCLKIEAAVPAFVLDRMEHWRHRFRDPDRPFNYHTSDAYHGVPDLFPGRADDQHFQMWALALASPFDLVASRNQFYYFRSGAGEVNLGRGRNAAMEAFLKDRKLIQETEQRISDQLRDLGTDKVGKRAKAWVDQKSKEYESKHMKPGIQQLIERELEEVMRWVDSQDRLE